MSFQDIYVEATEAGIFENIYEEQSSNNTVIEQPDVLEYEKPSLYSTQLSTSPYFLNAPVRPDLAGGDELSFKCLQTQPVDKLCHRSITFESPTAPSGPTWTCSPTSYLKSPAIKFLPSQLSPPPIISPAKQVSIQGKKPKKRKHYRSYDYKPLYITLSSWDIFEYNYFGELQPGRTYTAGELVRYLYSNPQNYVGETYNPKLGGLTLWIQRTPQNFDAEYGHPDAGLCRFHNCEHDNVIKPGDVRVAFDELTKLIPNLNPQHNAGYVHLSCLEKKMNFPMLCKDLDVKPEARVLPLECTHYNPMILQDRTELEHVQRFITFCNEMGRAPESYPSEGLLVDEILRFGPSKLKTFALKLWQKRGVEWDDEDKAKNKHSKDMYKVKRDYVRGKRGVAETKRARAQHEFMSESEEEHSLGETKPRAKIRPHGRTRRAPPTPVPESDFDSSALTEFDSESEEYEGPSRKRAKYAPTPRLMGHAGL